MAEIYLVRHGQASFGAENYDQLSDLGMSQLFKLGQSLKGKMDFDSVFHGQLVRHHQSTAQFLKGFESGLTGLELSGLDEFDHEEVLYRWKPEFEDKSAIRDWTATQAHPRRAFQMAFQQAVDRWLSGEFDHEYKESWLAFQQRVINAFEAIKKQSGSGSKTIVFTSGGPITAICKHVLGLNDANAFELNWSLVNGGMTQIKHGMNKVSVGTINEHHYFRDNPEFITYR